jgi:hypothetical protein
MRKLLIAAAIAATVPLGFAPLAHADLCDPGYVVGVPGSDGRLPVKCVPRGNIPPGYVDGTGGNAMPVPGTGHGAGYKSETPIDPDLPCQEHLLYVIKVDPETHNAIEGYGPPGCNNLLPMVP